jgi:hypothetical protein
MSLCLRGTSYYGQHLRGGHCHSLLQCLVSTISSLPKPSSQSILDKVLLFPLRYTQITYPKSTPQENYSFLTSFRPVPRNEIYDEAFANVHHHIGGTHKHFQE